MEPSGSNYAPYKEVLMSTEDTDRLEEAKRQLSYIFEHAADDASSKRLLSDLISHAYCALVLSQEAGIGITLEGSAVQAHGESRSTH